MRLASEHRSGHPETQPMEPGSPYATRPACEGCRRTSERFSGLGGTVRIRRDVRHYSRRNSTAILVALTDRELNTRGPAGSSFHRLMYRNGSPEKEYPMRGLLGAMLLVLPVFAGAGEDDPPRITPEMKAATEAIAQALDGLTPEGLAQKGTVERYSEANLYEKIDGRSELFHSYDVRGMTFVTFSKADDPAEFIDVFLYDMATPLGAFGIYSIERPSGGEAVATGDGGHRAGADLFFRKGRYYASILTSGPDEDIRKSASALADTLAKRLKGETAEIWGLAVLPAKGRVEDTVRYLMVDAMGLDFLTDTFTAQYRDGEAGFTAFVARCKSAEDAAGVLAKFRAHLEEFGTMAEPAKIEGAPIMFSDMGGDQFIGACQVGGVIAGVTEVKGRDAAVKAMTFLLKGLKIPK
jgi:hypothetical protein